MGWLVTLGYFLGFVGVSRTIQGVWLGKQLLHKSQVKSSYGCSCKWCRGNCGAWTKGSITGVALILGAVWPLAIISAYWALPTRAEKKVQKELSAEVELKELKMKAKELGLKMVES